MQDLDNHDELNAETDDDSDPSDSSPVTPRCHDGGSRCADTNAGCARCGNGGGGHDPDDDRRARLQWRLEEVRMYSCIGTEKFIFLTFS